MPVSGYYCLLPVNKEDGGEISQSFDGDTSSLKLPSFRSAPIKIEERDA